MKCCRCFANEPAVCVQCADDSARKEADRTHERGYSAGYHAGYEDARRERSAW